VGFVVLGIGVNANQTSHQLPPEGVSVKMASGRAVDRVKLFQEILLALETRYIEACQDGFHSVFKAWKERSITLGQDVSFEERGHKVSGKAFNIDAEGALRVRMPDGRIVRRVAGDVTFAGRAGR
jgi:BirA family biotin operon repressor/biotin-[acetyl-CoA-carboxylase] ligase